ncbi:hypothetical protein HELRODRAFT_104441 [Helobdella robusta]|uniref:UBX domain-containing protein n=1 Tax=Helobdella robusta TaxID=6412 RepID=T1EDL7_HELRO|nr:hypothetical protein HELRODRAFT_104441 [Helobdella robusta]ESN90122.1 hypothetical protein HELRODRAFT_104441 [Helobdella robusta]
MSAIKKFFENRKLDFKFKKAGGGHKLTDANTAQAACSSENKDVSSPTRSTSNDGTMTTMISDERKSAADAAIARLNLKKEYESRGYVKPARTMKAELLAEKREMEMAVAQASKYQAPAKVTLESPSVVTGVFFTCPMLNIDEPLMKADMEKKIEEYLYSHLLDEPELTSAMMIYTFNRNKDILKTCIETLSKYLNNVLENPNKPNFRQIRKSNKALNEKVLNCKGALEFLQATGFQLKKMKVNEESDEEDEFFHLEVDPDNQDELVEKLRSLLELLQVCEPVTMEVYRDLKIFSPKILASSSNKIEVSEDFFNVTPEELKREMKIREEAIKEMGMLQTKQMRERIKMKELRRYRFTAIRIKFPDNYAIQGTFRVSEKFLEVRHFVLGCLENDSIPFHLSTQVSGKITEDDKTLAELDLAPSSILQFSYDQNVLKDLVSLNLSHVGNSYIKSELLNRIDN